MYINNLGMRRIASVDNRNSALQTANTAARKNTDRYAAVMQRAVEQQKTAASPTFATAGDIIIQEAFKKMQDDPEWEASVMDKVKDYYNGDYAAGDVQKRYQNLLGQNSLQNLLVQSLLGAQSGLGLGVAGYSSYGLGNLAASSYGSVMNSAYNSSIFGNWQL